MKTRYLFMLMIVNSILLIGLIVLYLWNYLSWNTYSLYVSTNKVASLSAGAAVKFQGVPVGEVKKIYVDGKRITLKLRLSDNVRLPEDVKLVNMIDSGEPAILCRGGASSELIDPGDTIFQEIIPPYYPGIDRGDEYDPRKLGLLIDQISDVVGKLNGMLGSRESESDLADILNNFSLLSGELSEAAKNLNRIIENQTERQSRFDESWNKYLKTLQTRSDEQNKQMQRIIRNYLESSLKMEEYSARMVGVAEKMEKAIEAVNSDSGSLGKLIHDKELYQNLKNASLELNQLIKDFRKNPRQFFDSSVF